MLAFFLIYSEFFFSGFCSGSGLAGGPVSGGGGGGSLGERGDLEGHVGLGGRGDRDVLPMLREELSELSMQPSVLGGV